MQPSVHRQDESGAQTKDMVANKEITHPSAHKQEEMSAQTEDMAC